MSKELLKGSNTVWAKKQPLAELVDENISLNRKNRLLWIGLVGLSAFGALSVHSCRKAENALTQVRSENSALKQTVSYFQKDAVDLALKNQDLKPYKEFVNSIEPFYPDMIDGKTGAEEKEIEKQNAQGQERWNNACKTLGINPTQLFHLKEKE